MRPERDLRKKREAIEREMMELKIRLGEIEMQHIEDQERELRDPRELLVAAGQE